MAPKSNMTGTHPALRVPPLLPLPMLSLLRPWVPTCPQLEPLCRRDGWQGLRCTWLARWARSAGW